MEIMTTSQADIAFNVKDHVGSLIAFYPQKIVDLLVDVSGWAVKPQADQLASDGRLRKEAMECEAWSLVDGEIVDHGIVRIFTGPVFDALKVPLHRGAALAGRLAEKTGSNGWTYTFIDTHESAAVETFAAKLHAHLNRP